MGKTFSAYSYVQLEVSTLFPGDEVVGVANIQVDTPIEAQHLFICIKGKETTAWTETETISKNNSDGSSSDESVDKHYSGKRVILESSIAIYHFDGILQKGQYCIPFSTRFPLHALHSFDYIKEVKAKRYYTIKARLQNDKMLKPKKSFIWIPSCFNASRIITSISSDLNINVRNCCCFGNDLSIVNLNLKKNAYYMTEKIAGWVRVDQTACSKRLLRLNFSLFRRMRIRDDHSSSNVSCNAVISYDKHLESKDGADPVGIYEFELDLDSAKDLWQTPSVVSELIECEYEVKVRLYYDTFCSGLGYYVTAPVAIFNSYEVPVHSFTPPAAPMPVLWNPMVLASAPNK